jgi:hypothetical protein
MVLATEQHPEVIFWPIPVAKLQESTTGNGPVVVHVQAVLFDVLIATLLPEQKCTYTRIQAFHVRNRMTHISRAILHKK